MDWINVKIEFNLEMQPLLKKKEDSFKGKKNDVLSSLSLILKLILLVALIPTATSLLRSPPICNCSLFTRELQKCLPTDVSSFLLCLDLSVLNNPLLSHLCIYINCYSYLTDVLFS